MSEGKKPTGEHSADAGAKTPGNTATKGTAAKRDASGTFGKLRIGDNWNAITIIALSQSNPLKAIAEFVENSIDAKARNVTIIRGKDKGDYYLKVIDDGEGITDFTYVATHIGDSIKRRLKKEGALGIQGEFGIGLLSFWTVGDELVITSSGSDGKARRMKLVKGNPSYAVREIPELFGKPGTELAIRPILAGVRQLSGEKIQNYLASELRDRIGKTGVTIRIVDRPAKKELVVEPRQFHGRLIHNLPEAANPLGEIYAELYISEPKDENHIGLYRLGTRVMPDLTRIERFDRFPWNSRYLEGIIDASFLQLTPGTREGIVYDNAFESFAVSLETIEETLAETIREQEKAAEEEASKDILHRVTRALREAILLLPEENYGWLSANAVKKAENGPARSPGTGNSPALETGDGAFADTPLQGSILSEPTTGSQEERQEAQKNFFDYPGPLRTVIVSPASCIVGVGKKRRFRLVARDKSRRQIDTGLDVRWRIDEGSGSLDTTSGSFVEFTAPEEPGITILEANASQTDGPILGAQAIVTVTAELLGGENRGDQENRRGLPGYTYLHSSGELWRSRFDEIHNLIIINSGHADFIFAARLPNRKLRYIARLYAKELVLANFPEANREALLERMIELNLYMEENLK
jgi:hypothetical protein